MTSIKYIKSKLITSIYAIIGFIFHLLRIDVILERLFGIKRKVIARLDGGLGSQIWQFALGYSVAQDLNLPLYFDVSFFTENGTDLQGTKNRQFLLLKTFQEIEKQYQHRVLSHRSKYFLNILRRKRLKSIYEIEPTLYEKRNQFLHSYYINYRYIQKYHKQLKKLFTFYNIQLSEYEQSIKNQILSTSSCCIHIRRGDFVGTNHEVCSGNYYIEAIKLIEREVPNVTFFIFTNDESYSLMLCKQACILNKSVIFKNRSEIDPRVDLYLMSLFHHFIISNSGFSWFPAWLNSDIQEQIVVMPKYWTSDKQLRELSINSMNLPGWIQLDS